MRKLSLIIFALWLAPIASADEPFVVTYDGFGPVRIGMTKTEVSRVLGEKLVRTHGAGDIECEYLRANQHWDGIEFMFSHNRVARIDVRKGSTETKDGVRLGDGIQKVKKAYGKNLVAAPHQYIPEPEGSYLTAKSSNGKRAIRFETDNGRVIKYYVGRFPEVEYVEGCL